VILQWLLALSAGVGAQSTYDPRKALSVGFARCPQNTAHAIDTNRLQILFPGFQPLDVIGPLDIFQGVSFILSVPCAPNESMPR